MDRRCFLGALGASSLSAREEPRPNILRIIARGWRGQALPFGDGLVRAPNLERLAGGGFQFTRAYTPNPEMDGALTAIRSGRFPHLGGDDPLAQLFGEDTASVVDVAEAVEFILRSSQPFLLTVLSDLPAAGAAPEALTRSYATQDFRLRLNVPAEMASSVRRQLGRYYARCQVLDDALGALMRAVELADAAANTIVVISSTHGSMLGSHGLDGASEPFEEAVRVPLIIRYPPSIPGGRSSDMPVSTVDLAPTLLGLMGRSAPAALQGQDLSALLRAEEGARSESVYCQGRLGRELEWRMVVRGLDKVVVNRDLEITHLYNLGRDPYELENLVDEKSAARKRDEMDAILRDWMRRASDRFLPSGLKLRE